MIRNRRPHRALQPFALALAMALTAPASSWARSYFSENHVLPPDRTIDLVAWLPTGDPGLSVTPTPLPLASGDSSARDSATRDSAGLATPASNGGPWDCAAVETNFRLSGCRILDSNRPTADLDRHLYWALLNLTPTTDRGDLTARSEHRPSLDALPRPILALRKRADSCHYIIAHQDSYAPLAAGRIACPDLATALQGLERDLAGRFRRTPRQVSQSEKVVRPATAFFAERPRVLDMGFEVSVAAPIMLSTDKTEGYENGIYSPGEENFDLDDMAGHRGAPFAGRLFIQYRKLVGFRLGFEYGRLALKSDILSQISSSTGVPVDAWRIDRFTTSGELLLGKAWINRSVEAYVGAVLGISHTRYNETAEVDGRDVETNGILKNVTGPTLGLQTQLRIMELIFLGLESAFHFKDFSLKGEGDQPDGSASEIQFRIHLGVFHTLQLAEPGH